MFNITHLKSCSAAQNIFLPKQLQILRVVPGRKKFGSPLENYLSMLLSFVQSFHFKGILKEKVLPLPVSLSTQIFPP